MKTRVYLNDWFYNCGIIGFINILKDNENDFTIKENNYIEFDTKKLENFHEYYLNYFFNRYDVSNKMKLKIEQSFYRIKKIIEDVENEQSNKEKLKSEVKYIKTSIKGQMDKIKKFNLVTYENILDNYNKIDKIKEKSQIEELEIIKENIIKEFQKEDINNHLTLNLIKSILSNDFFGQQSLFNVCNSKKSLEEQKNIMYKDYISNIVETDFLNDILEDKYDMSNLKEKIEERLSKKIINKEVEKHYNNIIKKYCNKDKKIQDVKEYIKQEVFKNCELCGSEVGFTSNYTEGNFIPLAISSDNMKNAFWNENVKFPICDICKLIFLCIPAGVTKVSKTVKDYSNGKLKYTEKQIYSFVNMDTNIDQLLRTNNNFKANSKNENQNDNPYASFILDIAEQNEKITKWELQNIFVVEFESKYQKFSRMKYFNLKRYFIDFIQKYSKVTLDKIYDKYLKLEIIDYLIKDKDLRKIVNNKLYESMKSDSKINKIEIYRVNEIETIINNLKRGGIELEKTTESIELANKKIHVMFTLGNEIYEKLKMEGNENKLSGFIYKMLNSIKVNQKDQFTDTAIRLIWMAEKDVPEILVKDNREVNWVELGHSFISGLTQSKYVKPENK